MKKMTTPAVELTEAPAISVPVLSSRNKKLALTTQSSASESGPSTSGSAGKELWEGAGNICFITNTEALHLIAKTLQCCGSELEVREGAGDFCFIMSTEALQLIAKTFQ